MDSKEFDRWEEERKRRHAERQARRDERRRERQSSREGDERMERVLHTRVSDNLDEAIRGAAEELRVPVSNLVRNVLEDVFEVVETVTDNVGDLVGEILGDGERARERFRNRMGRHRGGRRRERPERSGDVADDERAADEAPAREVREFPDVVGWQPLILNGPQACGDCERQIAKGDRAFVGLKADGLSGIYLCSVCMESRR